MGYANACLAGPIKYPPKTACMRYSFVMCHVEPVMESNKTSAPTAIQDSFWPKMATTLMASAFLVMKPVRNATV